MWSRKKWTIIKKKRNNPEHDEQVKLFKMAANNNYLSFMFAIPNGGHRHIATAIKLKLEGVKAGVADIFLPLPISKRHGLFIEMKAPNKKQSDKQIAFMNHVRANNYCYVLCYSADEAIKKIDEYIMGKV